MGGERVTQMLFLFHDTLVSFAERRKIRMKKGIKWLKNIIFILPLLIYIILFILFEPYNYWGMRKDLGDVSSAITIVRKVINNDCSNIILGNSRLATLNTNDLNKAGIVKEYWNNLALNGASITEQCAVFWYTVKHKDVKKVCFPISFWDMNSVSEDANRFSLIMDLATDSKEYIFSSSTHRETLKNIFNNLFLNKNQILVTNVNYKEEQIIPIYQDYVNRIWNPIMPQYKMSMKIITEIIKVIEYCKEHNIELTVFALPMHNVIYDTIADNGLKELSSFYKKFLSLYTIVYDMEYVECNWTDSLEYTDGCHIGGFDSILKENFSENQPMLFDIFQMIFYKNGVYAKVWDNMLQKERVIQKRNILLGGEEELRVYPISINVEPNSVYLIECKGSMNLNSINLYMDIYGEQFNWKQTAILSYSNNKDCYWTVIKTEDIPNVEHFFRIVYQGKDDLILDELTVSKVN